MNDLDALRRLPHDDATAATPDVTPSEPLDPDAERICRCIDPLLADFDR